MNATPYNYTEREVRERLRIKARSTLWKLEREGAIPPSFKIGSRKRWRGDLVDAAAAGRDWRALEVTA